MCCDFVDLQQLQMNSLRFGAMTAIAPEQLAELANAKMVVTISFVTAPLWPENPATRELSWSASAVRRESFSVRDFNLSACLFPSHPLISVSQETHPSSDDHNKRPSCRYKPRKINRLLMAPTLRYAWVLHRQRR